MTGVEIKVDGRQIEVVLNRLLPLADIDRGEVLDVLGALGVSQTQRRISAEKASPDGEAWAPNLRGGSILVLEGHLLGSIDHEVSGDEAAWGSPLVYAAVHQYGGVIKAKDAKSLHFVIGNQHIMKKSVTIPARPYLGLSDANKDEIAEALNGWIGGLLQ